MQGNIQMSKDIVAEDTEMDKIVVVDFHPLAAADGLHKDIFVNTYFEYGNCMKFKLNSTQFLIIFPLSFLSVQYHQQQHHL